MQFMAVWTFEPDHYNQIVERFQETGGPPPEGVKMLGRWHDVAGGRGFGLAETDDPVALARWFRGWNDLMSFEVVPVVGDEQLAASLAG